MEQFKICEKDTKTKAYSKEGLAREARTDPKEIDREEKRCWLNDCLERLGDLVDSIDGEVEKMTSVKGGKTKMKDQVLKSTFCNSSDKHTMQHDRLTCRLFLCSLKN
jgi:CCR4-NOT transcription complex subunit 3